MGGHAQQSAKARIALVKPSVKLDNNINCNRPPASAAVYPVVGNENGILIVCSASKPHATMELSYQHTSRLENGRVEMVRTLT